MKIPVLFFAAFESTHSLLAAELQNRTARVRIPDWHGNDDAVDVLLVVECARQQETRELTAFFREQDKVVSDSHRAPVGKHSRWIALRIYRSHWTPKLQLVVSLLRNQRNVTKRSATKRCVTERSEWVSAKNASYIPNLWENSRWISIFIEILFLSGFVRRN